jgi:hypothetical protein
MLAVLLHLDEALTDQRRLHEAVRCDRGRVLDYRDLGPAVRLWSWPRAMGRLKRRLSAALPQALGPVLVFSGSGDFHHVTLPLVERAIAAADGTETTVVHFDNHPDWVRFAPGVHCGSWVAHACRLPGVRRVISVGLCSRDIAEPARRAGDLRLLDDGRLEIHPYAQARVASDLASRIETDTVYVTIDKDVLRADVAATNWDQGQTTIEELRALIAGAAGGRRLIGADVVGDWSRATYGGGLLVGLLKRAEALLDQPWRAPPPERLAANEDVNLALLAQFQALQA